MGNLIKELETSGCEKLYENGDSSVYNIRVTECPIFDAMPKLFPFAVIQSGKYVDCFSTLTDAVNFING